ncbi:zinc finger, CCHC-type containing protein, partial [Tanacetum coccineum]
MLEAVADQQLWFWHAYFGVPGANNDLNVLYGSPLFDDLLADKAPEAPFQVNGKTYEKGYYLADGIYPQWVTFVKAFTIARDLKTQKFKRVQESAKKDIERAFGVLQANLLSIGGRLTLIKSVLGSLGIYYLSIFRAPESVLQDLERIRAKFFWGGNKDENKMAWVKWLIILNSFDKGGLNIGIFQKWLWRLLSSPNALWVQVIKAYHGHEGGFDTNGCSFKGIWANIVRTSIFFHSK